jgi:uncharacterized 2Fe-2S/4Fe-4S cluster protein (DUF4445 family)
LSPQVEFSHQGVRVSVEPRTTLLAAARAAGVPIDAQCGGAGTCGRCAVRAQGALSAPTEEEIAVLGAGAVASGQRLACRARALGDVRVEEVATSSVRAVERAEGTLAWKPDAVEGPGAGRFRLALDIGTTTVVLALVDSLTGDIVAARGVLNAQFPSGADVMSRITAVRQEGLEALRAPLVSQVSRLAHAVLEEADAPRSAVSALIVCGNTTMRGIFLGDDVTPLGTAPYEGVPLEAREVTGAALGLTGLEHVSVHALPCASAFIGADVVAGIVATRFARGEGPALFIDLGTNAEIVLATGSTLLAASAAAGPALEGAGITSGMRAALGAIERVRLVRDALELEVIGDVPPLGLCGSGALDLLAALLDAGVLDPSGRLQTPGGPFDERVIERDDGRAFVVDPERPVVLTQKDVRAVQLAKGAVRAAVDLLLDEAGVNAEQMQRVVVAGGFGLHVDASSLVRIGMAPHGLETRFSFVGNAALEGARAACVSRAARREANRVAASIRTLDLASAPQFQDAFIRALDFPP